MIRALLLGLAVALGEEVRGVEPHVLHFAVAELIEVGQTALLLDGTPAPPDADFILRLDVIHSDDYTGGIPEPKALSESRRRRCVQVNAFGKRVSQQQMTTVDVDCSAAVAPSGFRIWGTIVAGPETAWIRFGSAQGPKTPAYQRNVVLPGVWLTVRVKAGVLVVLEGCVPRELWKRRRGQAQWANTRSHCAEFPLENQRPSRRGR